MLPLLLVALLAKPPAPDTTGPAVDHSPVTSAQKGAELVLTATIKDPSGVFGPTAYYRQKGEPKFSAVEFTTEGGGKYTAPIPGAKVTKDLEYYVEAYDELGNGPTRVGEPEKPLVVTVGEAKAAPVAQAEPEPTPEPDTSTPATPAEPSEGESDESGGAISVDEGGQQLPLGPIVAGGAGALAFVTGLALYMSASSTVAEIDARYSSAETRITPRSPADAAATRAAISSSTIGSLLMFTGVLAGGGAAGWYLYPRFATGSGGDVYVGLDGRF